MHENITSKNRFNSCHHRGGGRNCVKNTFFNNYLFLIFIVLLFYKKYWDRTLLSNKNHILFSLISLLRLAVASVCLTTFCPLWQNFEKEWNFPTFTASPLERTRQKSPDTPCRSSLDESNPINSQPDR